MKKSVKILWKVFVYGLLAVVAIFTAANFNLFGKMPSLKDLENPEADLATEVYSADGKLMGKYYAENRSEVKYSQISPNILNALIATEDERFKEHSGIDGRAVARAIFSGGSQGGGSTITQQLAKMMLGQGRGSFIKRGFQKIKEWIIAVKLERNFTKEEIITLYLNRAPWGGSYGIRNASITYFQKEPSELSIEESAVLVGMLKGPSLYDPIRHPDKSLSRRNTVIDQMENAGYIDEAQAAKLKSKALITNYKKPDESLGIAPYFRAVLADKLKEWCKNHKNLKTGDAYDLYRDGLRVYTTLDSRMQQYAEESVVQHMPVIQRKLNSLLKANGNRMWKEREGVITSAMKISERWRQLRDEEGMKEEDIKATFLKPVRMKVFAWNAKREIDTVMTPRDSIKYHKQLLQTSFVSMDPKSGEVKCWVGGIDFKWFKFDHVTAKRQVGSTFKPLLYSIAVQDAGYTPDTYISGGPLTLGGKTISGGGGKMAYCLAKSLNSAAWHLMGMIGVKRTIEFAQQCGITTTLPPYPSIALGAAEIPMLEMLRGYSMFPNKGYNTEPVFMSRIEDKNGNVLQEFLPETKQVLNETDAYTMVTLMKGVVQFGTGRSLNSYNISAEKAGKTGTTNDNTDGWFIGYTPELLAGTWVGCDDPFIRIYAGTSGGNEMALPKWGYFMNKVYADKKLPYGNVLKFEVPNDSINGVQYSYDDNLQRWANEGDSSQYEDQGNGGATDYMEETPLTEYNSEVPIESVTEPVIKDTGISKLKTEVPVKPEEKKDTKATTAAPAAKPDEKSKKPLKNEKPKTGGNNDY